MSSQQSKHLTYSPWRISFNAYDPADEGRREVILALGNGMFVTRAASTDSRADAVHYPGTYRAGCYNRTVSEVAGDTDVDESLVNLPNWLPLTFRIEGGPWFRLEDVDLVDFRHTLDLKAGITDREFSIVDDRGRRTRICESRLVSMAEPHLGALRLELRPENWSGDIEFKSALDGDVINDNVARYADYERCHLDVLGCGAPSPNRLWLKTRTHQSRIEIVQAVRTTLRRGRDADGTSQEPEGCRVIRGSRSIASQFHARAARGQTLAVEKVAVFYTSQDPGADDVDGAARSALGAAGDFNALRRQHELAWQELWRCASIESADGAVALALHLHIFHVLQTVSPHTAGLDAGVPARGWHGEGYRGHVFWDELFVFPFLNFRFPALARSLLLYRYRRLDAARAAARKAGYRGAMYPWRSGSDGSEVTPRHQKNLLSGHWMHDPTRLQRHIGSAVAFNVWHYYLATGDIEFLSDFGAEMILEIARFWASIAEYSASSERFEIKGVIGPDEYQTSYPDSPDPGLDNNAYTNVMAVWTLCRALEVLEHLPTARRRQLIDDLELTREEFDLWERVSRNMRVVFHSDGVISQFEGFEQLREFSKADLPPEVANSRVDWALEAIGDSADRYKVTKQADTLTLFYLLSQEELIKLFDRLGYRLDPDTMLRTAEYYLARTTHRSSLSRIAYAGALAQIDLETSWELYQRGLETDLHALKGESIAEGIHLGAMAGSLDILQRRYLGIEACREGLRIRPALPSQLGRIRMELRYRGNRLVLQGSEEGVSVYGDPDNLESVKLIHASGHQCLQPGEEISIGPIAQI